MTSVQIESAVLTEPAVRELLAELDAHRQEQHPEERAVPTPLDEDEVAPGRDVLLVATDEESGVALGCGAVRVREPGVAEITCMYVRPQAPRRHGIATALLAALEAEASALFADRVVLASGERQVEAVALYRRAGYAEIERFGEYADAPLSLCLGRTIAAEPSE
ncbi:GNAT family N-acetyltransferase [Pseudonocardia nigra]|uniref:GNAT family N-acetyltransferase n=1 Tax=Pseudonocardia nigra TaxID=1921578 RepID=UPI001C602033|nr:GNAT family N-acetyltransferase [Pseudonocardia nigra]